MRHSSAKELPGGGHTPSLCEPTDWTILFENPGKRAPWQGNVDLVKLGPNGSATPAKPLNLVREVGESTGGCSSNGEGAPEQIENHLHVLQDIIDHLPSGITLFGPKLDMIACNERFKSLLDFPDELFANGLPSFHDLALFNARRGEYGPGEPAEQAAEAVERAQGMQPHVFERTRPDGTVLEIRGQPLPNGGFVSIYTDITERKQAENEAKRLSVYLCTVLDHLPQGVSVVDDQLKVVLWNRALVERLGLPEGFMHEGIPLAELIRYDVERGEYGPGDPEEMTKERLNRILNHAEPRYTRTRPTGETLDVARRPMIVDGAIAGFVTTYADVTELTRARQALEHMAMHDQLTGLANRHKFLQRFAIEVDRRRRTEQPLSLLVVDIDYFKAINDRFGHLAGDSCLRTLADVFRATVRVSDVVGRFGGEEFVILLPDTGRRGALSAAHKICGQVRHHKFSVAGQDLALTVSVGVATLEQGQSANFDELMERADDAVYRAKRDGRNCVRVHQARK